MWESPRGSDDPRFLVIAHALTDAGEHAPAVPRTDLTALGPDRLIVHGELLTPDDGRPVGVVLALHAPTRQAVDASLSSEQARRDEHLDVQIHDWEFGGRR
jgi:hypothetical protein